MISEDIANQVEAFAHEELARLLNKRFPKLHVVDVGGRYNESGIELTLNITPVRGHDPEKFVVKEPPRQTKAMDKKVKKQRKENEAFFERLSEMCRGRHSAIKIRGFANASGHRNLVGNEFLIEKDLCVYFGYSAKRKTEVFWNIDTGKYNLIDSNTFAKLRAKKNAR